MYEIFERLLKQHNVTPYKVAKATGISTSTLSEWKNGSYTPKADKLQKIADYFNVTVDYLLGNEEIPVALSRDNGYEGLTEEQIEMIEIMKEEFRQRNMKKSDK